MKKGAFRFPMIKIEGGGGENPDPATYCPANGYIPNPINPADGWFLIAEFQTNSPNSTTFDPSITASSGEYAWDLGDGTYLIGDKSVLHTYLTTATRTVKLYGKGTCIITSVDFNNDNIVGNLNLSNSAFSSVTTYQVHNNSSMTGVTFASSITATISLLNIYSTGITGTLDLSMFSNWTSSGSLQAYSNPNLTAVTFASSITGTFLSIRFENSNLTGTLDLSKFTNFTNNASILLNNNVLLTSVVFPTSYSGLISTLRLGYTGLTGTLDLSMFSAFTASAEIAVNNTSITGVTFASSITGTFAALNLFSTSITGTLDLSKFSNFTTSAAINLYSNPNLTGVTFASSITGTINQLYIHSSGITGTLDLSKFSNFTTSAAIHLYSNPNLTGVTFASSIAGTINQLYIYSSGITGTLDLSKFTTYTATATVYLHGNTGMTGVTFPSSTITGFIRTMWLTVAPLSYVDFTKLKTGVSSLSWLLNNNGWSAAIVNRVLVDIDSISASGFTSRVINIGGTNADPDGSSGGYDGTAARNSLIAKGFTVTIT